MTPSNRRPDFARAPYAEHFPRLTFFYGIGPEELAKMPRTLLKHYVEKLPGLIAEKQLSLMTASAYPHLKEDAANELRREIIRMIDGYDGYGDDGESVPTQSFDSVESFAHAAAQAGVGVVIEDPEVIGA